MSSSESARSGHPERLGFRTKFLYGFGSIAFGAKAALMGLLLFYYNQVIGLPAAMVSLALAVSLFVDALWDPLIGHLSDGLRTRWGRRHPLMYVSAAPVAIFFILLWRPPDELTDWQTFAWLLSMVMLVRLSTSFYEVPSAALAPELAPDYHDRTVILAFRYVLGTFGSVTATGLGYFYFFRPTPEYPSGQLNPAAWGPLTICVALLIVASIILSTLGTHHRIPKLYRPPVRRESLGASLRHVGATIRNWNFGVVVVAGLIAGVGSGLYSGLALYLNTFFWELPARDVGFVVVSGLGSSLFAAFAGLGLSRLWGKKLACMTLFFASVITNGGPILLRLLGWFPENGDPVVVPILIGMSFLNGILATGGFIVVTSMIADVTEDVQVKTGRRSEGLLMSADSILQKTMSSLSALLPGVILGVVGFPEKAQPGQVDPEVIRNLALIYLPATAIISTLSIATWGFYRIDKARHERNLEQVREAEAAAGARIEAAATPETATPVTATPGAAPFSRPV